ncbi:MAG: AMP-binding protein [Marmoricola sp.]
MTTGPSTVREALLARAEDTSIAVMAGHARWTWQEYVGEAARRAHVLAGMLDDSRPRHVGLLMDNTPEMAFALGAAGLGGHVAVGLNTTRRGQSLLADIRRADCQVVLADARLMPLLDGLVMHGVTVLRTDEPSWVGEVATAPATPPPATPEPNSLFMLIFTSATSGAPKAVRITHEKITVPGTYLVERLGLHGTDVHYISMPLFHSNSVMAGWAPTLISGAAVALREQFSASEFLPDLRAYGATYLNYVGKALSYVLATPALPDDSENMLRLAFGNEAGDRDIAAFTERFGCRVIDGFGSTENAVVITRVPETPEGSLGMPFEGVVVLDPETKQECPRARLAESGQVENLDEATGELVNTTGGGQFAGYYKDQAATDERMRDGMYWSGDLAYRDSEGFVYFAGRTADWLRVDGENLAAAPVERILVRHPAIAEAAVYAVPDPSSGDQLVAALVLVDALDPLGLETFLAAQPDLGPKQWPRHVRILDALPRTATNKVLKRELKTDGLDGVDGVLWHRLERGTAYAPD